MGKSKPKPSIHGFILFFLRESVYASGVPIGKNNAHAQKGDFLLFYKIAGLGHI